MKVTLGITVLLSYSVFMLLIADNMPPTSEFFPLIGQLQSRSKKKYSEGWGGQMRGV